jgi:hypothetical protein
MVVARRDVCALVARPPFGLLFSNNYSLARDVYALVGCDRYWLAPRK